MLESISLTVRGIAYCLTFFGPVVALAVHWDRQDKQIRAVWAQKTGRLPIEYKFPKAEKAKRWAIGIIVFAASWLIAQSAFPGPWLDSD